MNRFLRLIPVLLPAVLLLAAAGCGSVLDRTRSAITAPGRWIANRGDTPDQAPAPGEAGATDRSVARTAPDLRKTEGSVAEAENLMRQQRHREAAQMLLSVTADETADPRPHALLGDCLYKLRRFEEARDAYGQALAIDAEYFPAVRGFGYVALSQGNRDYNANRAQEAFDNYNESLRRLRLAHRLRPGDDQVVYARAWAAEGVARFFYSRAINLQARGDLQGAETMYDKCMGFCREALDAGGAYQRTHLTDALPRALIGRVRLRMAMLEHEFGRLDAALQHLDEALLAWRGILERVDADNETAHAEVRRLTELRTRWQAEADAVGNLP